MRKTLRDIQLLRGVESDRAYKATLKSLGKVRWSSSLPKQWEIAAQYCDCHAQMGYFETALPYAQRCVALASQHWPRSKRHAESLYRLATTVLLSDEDHRTNAREALAAITEALSIATDLGESEKQFRGLLLSKCGHIEIVLADSRTEAGKALKSLSMAKALIDKEGEPTAYTDTIFFISQYYVGIERLDEAFPYLKDAMARSHLLLERLNRRSQYAQHFLVLKSLAKIYGRLKRYEEAEKLAQDALIIGKSESIAEVPEIGQLITGLRKLAKHPGRHLIESKDAARMCSQCEKIGNDPTLTAVETTDLAILACTGCCAHAWYCSEACQLKHWPTHKAFCQEFPYRMCAHCKKMGQESDQSVLPCSGCCRSWYCNRECQLADWEKHQRICVQ